MRFSRASISSSCILTKTYLQRSDPECNIVCALYYYYIITFFSSYELITLNTDRGSNKHLTCHFYDCVDHRGTSLIGGTLMHKLSILLVFSSKVDYLLPQACQFKTKIKNKDDRQRTLKTHKSKHRKVKYELFFNLDKTVVHILRLCCLQPSDKRTHRYKARKWRKLLNTIH